MDMPSASLFIRLRFTENPAAKDLVSLNEALNFDQYTFLSLNEVALEVVPRPYLSKVSPATIFNLVSTKKLVISGERFEQTGSALLCRVKGASSSVNYTVMAIFVSNNSLICPFTLPPKLQRANQLHVAISNDQGITWSENSL